METITGIADVSGDAVCAARLRLDDEPATLEMVGIGEVLDGAVVAIEEVENCVEVEVTTAGVDGDGAGFVSIACGLEEAPATCEGLALAAELVEEEATAEGGEDWRC